MPDDYDNTGIVDLINHTSNPEYTLYDPDSPFYLHSADPATPYFAGPVTQDDFDVASTAVASALQMHDPWVDMRHLELKILRKWDKGNGATPKRVIDGVVIRSTGTAPVTPWEIYEHEFMNRIINSNASVERSQLSAQCWSKTKEAFQQLHDRVVNAVAASVENDGAAWIGHGGDQARTHFTSVATWAQSIARAAELCGRQQKDQIDALSNTQHIMAGIPVSKISPDDINIIIERGGIPTQQQYDEVAAGANNRSQAAKVMTEFDQQLIQASTTTEFPHLPALPQSQSAPVDISGQPDKPSGKGTQPHDEGAPMATQTTKSPTLATHQPYPSTPKTVPNPGAVTIDGPPPPTTSGATVAATLNASSGPVLPSPPSTLHPADFTSGKAPQPSTVAPPVVAGPQRPSPITSPPSSPRIPAGKPVTPTAPLPAAPPGGAGKSTGATPHLPNATAETSARANEMRGNAGRAGHIAPMTPGGGRNTQPDDERKAPSYLIDHQTPEIFESEEKTVQPTIGDWKAEQQRRP